MTQLIAIPLSVIFFLIIRAIFLHAESRPSELESRAKIAARLDRYAGYWRFSRR